MHRHRRVWTRPGRSPSQPDWSWTTSADEAEDQVLSDQLVDRARAAIAHHRASTGRDITRDQLRAALRVSNATAGQLLNQLRPASAPVRRTLPMMRELTR